MAERIVLDDQLSSRERVLRTLTGAIPDRVPVNYAANAGIGQRLLAHFGLEPGDEAYLIRGRIKLLKALDL